ncbi:MAG: ABC transporter permease [Acidimicrobiia bacterium]|nr:ABC transporter permease [Acidimicrobiia bacterium]
MFKTTFRNLASHKVRFFLTCIAIVLGVGLLTGTHVLTDTVRATFDDLFDEVSGGVDLTVRAETAFENNAYGSDRELVDASIVDTVRAVDSVEVAEGSVEGYAEMVGRDGVAIQPPGAPALGWSWSDVPEFNAFRIRDGRPPRDSDEVVVDAGTADNHGLGVGERIDILLTGTRQSFEIVGVARFGEADNLAGATVALFDPATAVGILTAGAGYSSVQVKGVEGGGLAELQDDVDAVLPDNLETVTAAQLAEETASAVTDGFGIFETGLLVFAGVSLFVAGFIIFNTFSMVVAQRSREIGVLRAIGAGRRQIMVSVIVEAVVMAVLGAGLGVLFGLAVAHALLAVFDLIGISLPSTDLRLEPGTVYVGFGLALVVTVLAAVVPARRAAKVSPIAAMTGDAATGERSPATRYAFGAGAGAVGAGLVAAGLVAGGDWALSAVGGGAVLVFLAVAALSPLVARPVAGVLGRPIALLRGVPGHLAKENAQRDPRRTAATAAGLVVGIALVTFASVFAQSLKASTTGAIRSAVRSDFVVVGQSVGVTFGDDVTDRIRDTAAVEGVVPLRGRPEGALWRLDGVEKSVVGLPADGDAAIDLDVVEGSFGALTDTGVLVHTGEAEAHGWSVGETIPMEFAKTGIVDFTVVGIYSEDVGDMVGDYVVSTSAYDANFSDPRNLGIFFSSRAGSGARGDTGATLAAFPNVRLLTLDEFVDEMGSRLDQMLGLVFVLLTLAIVIATLGIVTTLALAVFERTREIGLMRAVGMGRRQVRAMVRWEAVIVAVYGAVLGVATGLVLSWAAVTAMESSGLTRLVVPFGLVGGVVVVAAVAGVVAAVLPARRAARLDVLESVAAV